MRPAGRESAGKFEAGDGNAVRFLYRTIETRSNMRDDPFKGTRNLTHCRAYAKAADNVHSFRSSCLLRNIDYQFLAIRSGWFASPYA